IRRDVRNQLVLGPNGLLGQNLLEFHKGAGGSQLLQIILELEASAFRVSFALIERFVLAHCEAFEVLVVGVPTAETTSPAIFFKPSLVSPLSCATSCSLSLARPKASLASFRAY